MSNPHYSPSEVSELTRIGKARDKLISIHPSQRQDLDFGGALLIVSQERLALNYVISAELPRKLKQCVHCGSPKLKLQGRYVVRLADIPYVDENDRAVPVHYAITAQRYQCSNCNRGDVEPFPPVLLPVITSARITQRLSEWLIYAIQTETTYDTLARMTDYSKVWVRKWYQEIREKLNLPPKPSRPGRKPLNTPPVKPIASAKKKAP